MSAASVRAPKKTRYDAVVAGYLGIDLAPRFAPGDPVVASEFFRPGTLVETQGLSISVGGVVANTGQAFKAFGCRVAAMGVVGFDALGDVALASMRQRGLAREVARTRQAGTAYGIVLAPPGLDRMFLEDPGCNRFFGPEHVDWRVVAQARLFHFGYPPLMDRMWADEGAELFRMFRRAHRLGVATSLDLSLPDRLSRAGRADWKRILTRVLPWVDVFVPSVEEIAFMLGPTECTGGKSRTDVERLAEAALALGAAMVMIKCGEDGAYFRIGDVRPLASRTALNLPPQEWNDRALWARPYPVDTRRFQNACGAGDCSVAAFLTALLRGHRLETAAQYAMLAGRDNLYGADACSGLSDWASMSTQIGKLTNR